MARAYDLLIFDLDGTLADTAPDIERCLNLAMEEFSLPPVPHERVLRAIGPGGKAFYEAILPDQSLRPMADQVVARYRAHYVRGNTVLTRPFAGVPEMLDALRRRGVRMAVASNKPQAQTKQIIVALGLSPYFAEVVGPESVEHPKPAPDMLRLVMDRCGVEPARAAMVGDTENDMGAGRSAGATTVFVAWGYLAAEEIAPGLIDRFVEHPSDLVLLADGALDGEGKD